MSGHAGGNETILDFKTTKDSIAFSGYGPTSPVASETVDPTSATTGNDVITLSDGTQITLVGVDQKLFDT
jgi:hypothetical protein